MYSNVVTVDVVVDPCTIDTVSYNTSMPSQNSAYYKMTSNIPRIYINEATSTKPSLTLNIADRFVKATTLNMCDYTDFKIEKVLAGTALLTPSTWANLFSIDSFGNFKVKDFSKPVSDYKVYVSPYNEKIWLSLPSPIALLTLSSSSF